ncbi:MFS transporter, partial [Erwinia sp. S38]|nr:MFS transporter [Erwinia sp. S38]
VGSWGGGYAIDAGLGFRSPILLGLILAAIAMLTMLPGVRLRRRRMLQA